MKTNLLISSILLFFLQSISWASSIDIEIRCDVVHSLKDTIVINSPRGNNYEYSLNGATYQPFPSFVVEETGAYIVTVRNTDLSYIDSVNINVLCKLEPFVCGQSDTNSFYQVYYKSNSPIVDTSNSISIDSNDIAIDAIDLTINGINPLPNSPGNIPVNAIGMNPADQLAYGIVYETNELAVIDATGEVVVLGKVQGLVLQSKTFPIQSGDFGPNGLLHVRHYYNVSQNLDPKIYAIDVNKLRVEYSYQPNAYAVTYDIALNPMDNLFYTLSQNLTTNENTLLSIEPVTGNVSIIGNATYQGNPLKGEFGAMYSNASGRIWGIQNQSGEIYEFDISTAVGSLEVQASTAYLVNDGFSCPSSTSTPPPTCCNTPVEIKDVFVQCSVNAISVYAQSGNCTLEYSIDGGATFQKDSLFLNVGVGRYTVVVRDINECNSDEFSLNVLCDLEPFVCSDMDTNGLYQVYADGNDIVVASIDLLNNGFNPLPKSPGTIPVNAIGMNPVDQLAYGIVYETNELAVIDATGEVVVLGEVQGLVLQSKTFPIQSGDFGPNGLLHVRHYYSASQNLDPTIYAIDVNKLKVEYSYQPSSYVIIYDMALNPRDNLFYAVSRDLTSNENILLTINPINGNVSHIGVVTHRGTPLGEPFGAIYSDESGEVWGIQNSSGKLYSLSTSTGEATFQEQVASTINNDGFSCRNTMSILAFLYSSVSTTIDENSEFNVYPNPSSGVYQVEMESVSSKERYLEVLDLNGRILMKHLNPSNVETIDLSLFDNGIYIFRIVHDKGLSTKRVVKL